MELRSLGFRGLRFVENSKLRKKEKDFKSSKNSRIFIVLFRETIDNIGEKNFEQNVKSTWIRRMDREIG